MSDRWQPQERHEEQPASAEQRLDPAGSKGDEDPVEAFREEQRSKPRAESDAAKKEMAEAGRGGATSQSAKDAAGGQRPNVAEGAGREASQEAQQSKPTAEGASPEQEPLEAQRGERRPEDPKDADDVLTTKMPDTAPGGKATAAADAEVLAMSRGQKRRSFLLGGAAAAGAYGFYHWLNYGPQRNMVPKLLDQVYDANGAVSRTIFREHALAPTYPLNRAETLRVNGVFGLKKTLKLETWRLQNAIRGT